MFTHIYWNYNQTTYIAVKALRTQSPRNSTHIHSNKYKSTINPKTHPQSAPPPIFDSDTQCKKKTADHRYIAAISYISFLGTKPIRCRVKILCKSRSNPTEVVKIIVKKKTTTNKILFHLCASILARIQCIPRSHINICIYIQSTHRSR